jgi:hypothetical protein
LDKPSLHKFGIVLETRVKVLFGADQFGDGHDYFYDSVFPACARFISPEQGT